MSSAPETNLEEVRARMAGRPTKYTEDIGLKIIEEMKKGYSLAAAAAEFDISRKTIYNWKDEHPEFDELVQVAMVKRQRFLEERLMTTQSGAVVTSTTFALKNAGAADWREKQEIEHVGAGGGALQFENTQTQRIVLDASMLADMSPAQLEALAEMAKQQKLLSGG